MGFAALIDAAKPLLGPSGAITAETVQATLKQLVDAGNMFEVVMFPE